jgi:hypothetical protein
MKVSSAIWGTGESLEAAIWVTAGTQKGEWGRLGEESESESESESWSATLWGPFKEFNDGKVMVGRHKHLVMDCSNS